MMAGSDGQHAPAVEQANLPKQHVGPDHVMREWPRRVT